MSSKSVTALRFGGIILTNPSNVIFRQEVTPDLGTCGRNLKPCTTLSYMAMDSSIYSSPGHVVQKVVQRFVLVGYIFFFWTRQMWYFVSRWPQIWGPVARIWSRVPLCALWLWIAQYIAHQDMSSKKWYSASFWRDNPFFFLKPSNVIFRQ